MRNPMTILSGWWQSVRNVAQTARDVAGGRHAQHRYARNVSGVHVIEDNAMTLSTVYAAVRTIVEPIACMPFRVYRQDGASRIKMPTHAADWLISMQPNPEINAVSFWETMLQYAILRGNAFAEIERNNRGEPVNLWPIEPWRVSTFRNEFDELMYRVSNRTREVTEFAPADILHLHGLGDGVMGYSVIGLARETIGLGLAMEQFGAAFFGNGAHLGGVIEAPVGKALSPEAVDAMLKEFNDKYRGPGRAGQTTYIDQGMQWKQIAVPPEDAQFLESRKFGVTEICRWFGVPPHRVFELDRSTNNNIEQQSLEFVQQTLLPWARRIELECDIKFFGRQQRGVYYTKLNFASLLRADIKSQHEAFAIGRQNGWLSANDIRELQDMNPIGKGGDDYLVQVNMMPLDLMREQTQANIDRVKNPPAPAPGANQPSEPKTPGTGDTRNAVLALAKRFGEIGK